MSTFLINYHYTNYLYIKTHLAEMITSFKLFSKYSAKNIKTSISIEQYC